MELARCSTKKYILYLFTRKYPFYMKIKTWGNVHRIRICWNSICRHHMELTFWKYVIWWYGSFQLSVHNYFCSITCAYSPWSLQYFHKMKWFLTNWFAVSPLKSMLCVLIVQVRHHGINWSFVVHYQQMPNMMEFHLIIDTPWFFEMVNFKEIFWTPPLFDHKGRIF